jgi:hypothetical protein
MILGIVVLLMLSKLGTLGLVTMLVKNHESAIRAARFGLDDSV